jgi:hypothetical protein
MTVFISIFPHYLHFSLSLLYLYRSLFITLFNIGCSCLCALLPSLLLPLLLFFFLPTLVSLKHNFPFISTEPVRSVTFLSCIRKCLVLILAGSLTVLTEGFRSSPHLFEAKSRMHRKVDHDPFLSNPLQCSVHNHPGISFDA